MCSRKNGFFGAIRAAFSRAIGMIIVCVLLSTAALAQSEPRREPGFDYRIGFAGRSYPIGGALYGEGGYDIPIWGDTGGSSVWYGFIRPMLRASTSAYINTAEARLEFHPVSFLGFKVGRSYTTRIVREGSVVDCENTFECGGLIQADYGTVELLLGSSDYFGVLQYDWRDLRPSRDGRDFWEDYATIVGRSGYDRTQTAIATLGTKLGDLGWFQRARAGVNLRRIEADLSGSTAGNAFLFFSHGSGEWGFTYAGGVAGGSAYSLGASFAVLIDWIPSPGLLLN